MREFQIVGWLLALVSPAAGDFLTNFEAPLYSASPEGEPLVGQHGWYIPPVNGSIGFNAHAYLGNAHSLPTNEQGQDQFVAGRGESGAALPRAERAVGFSTSQTWCFSWDFACNFDGIGPATHNLASFSLQPGATTPPTSRIFMALNTFVDPSNPVSWSAGYVVHNAAGVQSAHPGLFAGPQWQNLPLNTWFRQRTEVDLSQNRIVQVSITNLSNGATATVQPAGWYLGGGAVPLLPLPTAVRIFAGGTTEGNIAGFDNILIMPECGGNPCACTGDLDGSGSINIADLSLLLSSFGTSGAGILTPCADIDGDGTVAIGDLALLLATFGAGC